MIISDEGGTSFAQPPAGTHVARCISIIDLGTQRSTYEGEAQIKHQLVVRWELCNELMTDGEFAGKPFTVGKFYTASLNEKARLRIDLAAWRGRDFNAAELKGFDLKTILGKACMVSIGLSEKGKAKVTAVIGLPRGTQVPEQVNESFHFSLTPNEFKAQAFEELSKGFKAMVEASPEYQAIMRRSSPTNTPKHPAPTMQDEPDFSAEEDEIPF